MVKSIRRRPSGAARRTKRLRYDYVSDGLTMVEVAATFPHRRLGNPEAHPWSYLRRDVPHLWYVDDRFPVVGFLNADESAVLHSAALAAGPCPKLEIGCWRGWSTTQIALAGGGLDVVDPVLLDLDISAEIYLRLVVLGVADRVAFHRGGSPEMVHYLGRELGRRWGFAFIDGDHENEAPAIDALTVAEYASEDCLIMFHDLASPDVCAGLDQLAELGWNTAFYQTMQIMGAAWRGDISPPSHIPDPRVIWHTPGHLARHSPIHSISR